MTGSSTTESPRRAVAATVQLAGRLLLIFSPVLALVALTAALALSAWLFGWRRTEMLVAASMAGVLLVLLTSTLLYVQIRQRQAANRSLRNIQAQMGDIVESAMDPIITVDEAQDILVFNSAAEQVFGWTAAEIIGQPLERLVPARFRAGHRQHIERFGVTGTTSRRMGGQTVLTALHASGAEFPIEASISKHSEEGHPLYTVIVRDVTARVRAEEALRRSEAELRELGAAAHQAREQEKSRISRELHDELGQTLMSLQMDVAWCRQHANGADAQLAGKLERMDGLLRATVAATRRIAADLRPLMLDDLGLAAAAEWLVENFTEGTGVPCRLAMEVSDSDISDVQASAVFRTIQESLNNAAKHACASSVDVVVDRHEGQLRVTVRDDGVGFAPDKPRNPRSFGLLGLRERTSMLGGHARIDSAPGRGTSIEVSFPAGQESSA